ncbi:unnamed protein product [Pleuronectes platessa]|uniref:Uncharacterized protein n=1 Tax=Pleuronectes platessa TaxID=8262 RepID=A0A9N7UM81_PLEPL|nr:unnamed protein product [Pleuronectes platessa]
MEFTQKVKQMDINAETVRPYFESFFTKLTAEQWERLKSCKPDEATTFMLAELLLNLMTSVSNAIVKRRPRSPVSEDKVRSILGDTLNNSLSPGSTTTSESLDKLTDLVVEEVTETVNSTLSASSICVSSEKPIPTRLINPAKVQQMICYACESLKTDGRINQLVKQSWAISSEEQDPSDDPILVSRTSSSSYSSRVSSKSGSSSEGGSTASSVDSVKRLVQETINESLTDITDFFNEFNDSLSLNSLFSSEIDLALDEIIESISEESTNGKEYPETNFSNGKAMGKINRLFIKTFAAAGTLQILSKVAKKFNENPKFTSRKAMQSLIASIDAVLLEKEKPGGGNESSAFKTLEKPRSEKVIVFTKQLSDLIYSHIAPGKNSDRGSGLVKKSSSLEVNSLEEKRSEQSSPSSEFTSRGNERLKQSTPAVVTSSMVSSGGKERLKQPTPAVVTSRGKERLKQSTPAVVTSSGSKRSKQSSSSEVSSGGNERLKQSTLAVVTSSGSKSSKQSTPAVVTSSGSKRSNQSSSSEVSSGGNERLKQSTPAVVTSSGSKRSKQSSSSEVSSGGNERLKQSTLAVVTSSGSKRSEAVNTSSEVSSGGNERPKQSTPAVISSSGKKRSKQSSSSEVSKECENSGSSDRRAREKIEKIQAEVKYKMYVSVLSDKLVTQIYKKAKVTCNDDDTRRHLMERIWAEVKDIDSPYIPKRSLDMDIYKELSGRILPPLIVRRSPASRLRLFPHKGYVKMKAPREQSTNSPQTFTQLLTYMNDALEKSVLRTPGSSLNKRTEGEETR